MRARKVHLLVGAVLCAAPYSLLAAHPAPVASAQVTNLLGIYQSSPTGSGPGGRTATESASLEALPLTPAAENAKSAALLKPDPKDLCQVLGPFRTMARPDVKFEILRDPPDKLVMVFENLSWGHLRTVALDSPHGSYLAQTRPLWNGDSVATWIGDTLVIDSVHFTNRTWLNELGVANSKQLHLTEHLRLLSGGRVLEYSATAEDPEVLLKPVSYTRHFARTSQEIQNYDCVVHKPVVAATTH